MRAGGEAATLGWMTTTYAVRWRTGGDSAFGVLEITADAVVFTASDGAVADVPLADIPAVHRSSSTVELERRSGDAIRVESAAAGIIGVRLEAALELAATLRSLVAEHERVRRELADLRLAVGCLADLTDSREREVAFLATDLTRRIVDHCRREEQRLYPVVAASSGCAPLVELMIFDHGAIEDEAHELACVDAGDSVQLARVFHRLDALLTAHVAKEEAIVFPLLGCR